MNDNRILYSRRAKDACVLIFKNTACDQVFNQRSVQETISESPELVEREVKGFVSFCMNPLWENGRRHLLFMGS